jgi:hypothetical protein
MKKLLIPVYILAVISFMACRKDMTNLNTNPKNATNVPGETLFSDGQLNFADIMTSPSVNDNIFEFFAQFWAATTYTQESRYDLGNRNVPQRWWTVLYRDVLMNYDRARLLISIEEAITDEEKATQQNKLAVLLINKVHTYSVLVNTFGNIPYTDAFKIDSTTTPRYDDQKTVYYALLDSLDMAISKLDPSGDNFGDADLLYHGDGAAWVKFANSLKLRLALLIFDTDPTKAAALITAAAPNVFTSNADNAVFQYLTAPPNTNPIWDNLVQSNRNYFVPANTLVNVMNDLSDPRRPAYFTTDPNGGYSGGIYGNGNSYGNFSHVADAIKEPNFPTILLDYAEVEFSLAEAVERGVAVGGTAQEHYNKAITASITSWGGTALEATTYLANPKVNYITAAGTWQQKIGVQAWIALYLRGFDAWTSWRKLDYPKLVKPALALSEIPVRYTYPINEQNLNSANYKKASADIGGDAVTTKLFWDK